MSLDVTFSALADPTRRRVIELLGRESRRASDLADACDASRPAMSRHLKVLRAAGIVETDAMLDDDRDQRERTYRLRPACFEPLRAWLEETDRFWSAQLEAFAAHVKRTRP